MESQSAAVHVTGICKTFNARSRRPIHALQDVSFEITRGQIVGLIGPNGAGKTTLLRILLGYLQADTGSVFLLGDHPESLAVRAKIGYQADFLFRARWISVERFLRLSLSLLGKWESEHYLDEALDTFGLHGVRRRSLGTISKGMRQKTELAFAFLGDPELVMLDEPTASLDPPAVFDLREYLAKKKNSHMTVLFSSHHLTEVENVCDRVLFINEGLLVGDYEMKGRPAGFLEDAFRQHLTARRNQV